MEHEYLIIGRDERYQQEVPLLKIVSQRSRWRILMFVPEPRGYRLVETNHKSAVTPKGLRFLLVVDSYRRRKREGSLAVSLNYVYLQCISSEWAFIRGGDCSLSKEGDFIMGAIFRSGDVVFHALGILDRLSSRLSRVPV